MDRKLEYIGVGPHGFMDFGEQSCPVTRDRVHISYTHDIVCFDLLSYCHNDLHEFSRETHGCKATAIAFVVHVLMEDDQFLQQCFKDAALVIEDAVQNFIKPETLLRNCIEHCMTMYGDIKTHAMNEFLLWLEVLPVDIIYQGTDSDLLSDLTDEGALSTKSFCFKLGYTIRLIMFIKMRNVVVARMVAGLLSMLIGTLCREFEECKSAAFLDVRFRMGVMAIDAMFDCTHIVVISPSRCMRDSLVSEKTASAYIDTYMRYWKAHVADARKCMQNMWFMKFGEVHATLITEKTLDLYKKKHKRNFVWHTNKISTPPRPDEFKWRPHREVESFVNLPGTYCTLFRSDVSTELSCFPDKTRESMLYLYEHSCNIEYENKGEPDSNKQLHRDYVANFYES